MWRSFEPEHTGNKQTTRALDTRPVLAPIVTAINFSTPQKPPHIETMNQPPKRISFFALAAVIGAGAFGVLWLPNASAAQCSAGPATVCYKGSTYYNVPAFIQAQYLANGGSCGPCQVSPN